MVEPITRQSALRGRYREGVSGADSHTPGIELQQHRVNAVIQLNGIDAPALERLQRGFGFDAAPEQRAVTAAEITLLWTGPEQWLLISEQIESVSLVTQLEKMLADTDATATDLSHGRVIARIAGSQARALLAKACPLDIESLTLGDCAATHLGAITVIIHWHGDNVYDLYVSRSFAVSLWEWLLDAAQEFGCHYLGGGGGGGGEWTHNVS